MFPDDARNAVSCLHHRRGREEDRPSKIDFYRKTLFPPGLDAVTEEAGSILNSEIESGR
jgi:hypothetical protein